MAYRTTCPGCGEDGYLEVVSGSFSATGMTLGEEGFSFCDAKQVDTEDEVVGCRRCGWAGSLGELDQDAAGGERHRASGRPDASLIQRGHLIKVIRRWGSEIFVNLFLATGDAMHQPRRALSAAAAEVAQHLGIPAAEDAEPGSFDWATFLESATREELARHGLRHIDLDIDEEIVVDDCDDPRKLN